MARRAKFRSKEELNEAAQRGSSRLDYLVHGGLEEERKAARANAAEASAARGAALKKQFKAAVKNATRVRTPVDYLKMMLPPGTRAKISAPMVGVGSEGGHQLVVNVQHRRKLPETGIVWKQNYGWAPDVSTQINNARFLGLGGYSTKIVLNIEGKPARGRMPANVQKAVDYIEGLRASQKR